MIRNCTADDIPELLEMGRKFCKLAGRKYNEDALSTTLKTLIDSGILIRSEKGCIGGLVFRMFMSGELTAQEFFWWSEDKQGRNLLEAFEEKAKEMGVVHIIMVSLANSDYTRVGDIYEKAGYEFLESNFIKRI